MSEQNQKPLFKNGMSTLFPYTEHGLSVYGVLESAWMMMALMRGINGKIWEDKPENPNHPVFGAWVAMGLIQLSGDGGWVLTDIGRNLSKVGGLFECEWAMMKRTLDGDHTTDPALYNDLRTALQDYAETYNPELLDWVMEQMPHDGSMVDLCCGDGMFAMHTKHTYPQAGAYLVDKHVSDVMVDRAHDLGCGLQQLDVLSEDACLTSGDKHDMIVISEALHCMSGAKREQVYRLIAGALKPGGCMIVVEQHPNLRLAWRMHEYSSNKGHCLPLELTAYEGQVDNLMRADVHITTATHYAIKFVKTEEETDNGN